MKFGTILHPELIDFTLPPDHPDTNNILHLSDRLKPLNVFVGCAKWNRTDLKNFYPRGTKDELAWYSGQFNSIEMNTTFYRVPDAQQFIAWRDKTPAGFKFFPKINQRISHIRRLKDTNSLTEEFCNGVSHFEEKLGMVFLQLHDNFGFKNYDRMVDFVEHFPKTIPLAVELRNTNWFNDPAIASKIYHLFESHAVTNIIVDTAGRRDLLHMRLTTPAAFVRYVGSNHPKTDRKRLDDWSRRISDWVDAGLREVYFFVHQNEEIESPVLADYIIRKLNRRLGTKLKRPEIPTKR